MNNELDELFEALKYRIVVGQFGDKYYYNSKDQLHRENGPAIQCAYDGSKLWYINDKLHREDGPAIVYANGSKAWYINGKQLTEEEFNQWRKDNSR